MVTMEMRESTEKIQTRAVMLALIEEAQNVNDEKSLKYLFHGRVNELIPHQMAVCGIGERGKQYSDSYINIGFPEVYLRSVIIKNRFIASPVVKAWSKKPVAQIFNNLISMKKQNPLWGKAIERHGIRNMIVNGLPDIAGDYSSYFCLAQCPEPITEEHRQLMELITPHLHKALLFALNEKSIDHPLNDQLTAREHEVLHAMCQGYTNKEIAVVLGISGNTIRNHVYRICEKLEVSNRTEAVARTNLLMKE